MRNTKSIFAAIIIAIFALTSCQKENMSELSTNITSTQNRMTPEINTVNNEIKTQFTLEMGRTKATSRNGGPTITCISGQINDSTIGSDNYFDAINSPCLDGKGDFFDGPDKSYPIIVDDSPEESVLRTIILTKMEQDLDLFVFALDSDGRVGECVATSITHGLEDEVIELRDLAPGYYEIVVDGWNSNIQSTFELTGFCSSTQVVPENEANTLVNKVVLGFETGEKIGILQQISTIEWAVKEIESGTTTAIMTEIRRDNQNIYLKTDSGPEGFQIDLLNKKLLVNTSGTLIEYTHILEPSAEINGYLANTISLGKDGQLVGKLHRQFDIAENKEMWANGTHSFYTLSNEENNIFMTSTDGLTEYNFDFDKMKVIVQTVNTYDEVFDILSFE